MGHIGRDLVILVEEAPEAGRSVPSQRRLEMAGGKAANQAVALTQMGCRAAVVGVVGDDRTGRWVLDAVDGDGVDVSAVMVRPGTPTSLVVSIVDRQGAWRYVEDLPAATFVQHGDIEAGLALVRAAAIVCLQMQEPAGPLLRAARAARSQGGMVVADGAPDGAPEAAELLASVDVLRADRHEAELLAGRPVRNGPQAIAAARRIAVGGPPVVVLAAGRDGNAVVWPGGEMVVPLGSAEVVDTTGGGDAMVAGMVAALLRDRDDVLTAVCLGTAAAAAVVGQAGGRPSLSSDSVWSEARRLRERLAPGS